MALLNIAQRVADEVGLPRSVQIATGSDQLARQMFALANATIEDLRKMNWPVLNQVYQFVTAVGQEAYALPTGYKKFITDTAYNASTYYEMRGSLSASEWERRKNGFPNLAGRYRWRIKGYPLKLYITPVPQLAETIVIEYVSKNSVIQKDGTLSELFMYDTDVPLFPEELVRMGLKWRIKHAKGLDYSEDYNAYDTAKKEQFADALALGSLPVSYRSYADAPELGDGYIPDGNWNLT